eukprot:3640335-Rhodomonas_salina.1
MTYGNPSVVHWTTRGGFVLFNAVARGHIQTASDTLYGSLSSPSDGEPLRICRVDQHQSMNKRSTRLDPTETELSTQLDSTEAQLKLQVQSQVSSLKSQVSSLKSQ